MRKLTPNEAEMVSRYLVAVNDYEDLIVSLSDTIYDAPSKSRDIYWILSRGLSFDCEEAKDKFGLWFDQHILVCHECATWSVSSSDDAEYSCEYGHWLHGMSYGGSSGMPWYEYEWADRKFGRANALARRIRGLHKKIIAIPSEALKGYDVNLPNALRF